ncbi:MAG: hypothetical protein ACREMX_01970, partial [Gemmatimonadales bacterium]
RGAAARPAAPPASESPPARSSSQPPERIAVSLEALREAWPEIVEEVRRGSRFLAESLAATTPAGLDPP